MVLLNIRYSLLIKITYAIRRIYVPANCRNNYHCDWFTYSSCCAGKKYVNRVLITPVAFIVIMIAVGVFLCLKVNNGKMTVEAEFYNSVSSSFFEDGRYHTVTIDDL